MSRRIVNLHLEGGQTIPGECWETAAPGLIITQGVTTHRILSDEYCVTHEASGCRIGDPLWSSVELAQMFVNRIVDYVDWSLEAEQLQKEFPGDAATHLNNIAVELQKAVDENPRLILEETSGYSAGHTTE